VVRIVIVILVLGMDPLAGCARERGRGRVEHTETRTVADVVARAGHLSIGASEIETRMTAEKLSADAALEQLISEALLVQEAERIGCAEDREGERAIERIMVRAMLHDLEKENTPELISEAEVRAYYVQRAENLPVPEHRTLAEVEEEVRERLSQKKRLQNVVEIVQRLEAQGLVQYDESGVERLLSMTGLPARAE
jgi:hypothetical protein